MQLNRNELHNLAERLASCDPYADMEDIKNVLMDLIIMLMQSNVETVRGEGKGRRE